ncbi:F0F1 ATP synthase subunit delta [Paenibacillus larvae]|nr:F0F1 ATP synthase subunit delta [Paenibacillus larvae]MDT2263251.1 F0F1 ATP synthase subunit delta [Paenibacillus larvae]MDT2274685.1 F0F1 ATP synthase subunit delta [Paenibacillus larvae]
MNNDIVVAKRYAKALFEVAQEQNTVSQVEEELKVMVELIQGDRELDAFLNHPNVESDVKNDVLQKHWKGKCPPLF